MKSFVRSAILGSVFCALGLPIASLATTPLVSVSSPANNAQVASPVNYVATASSPQCSKGIAAMRIYTAPSVSAYSTYSNHLNTNLTLQPGAYNTVVQAWDNCGGVGKTPVNITVKNTALQPARYLYVSDANNRIWGYRVNASSGSLSPNGQGPVAVNNEPFSLAADKGGYRLYATALTNSHGVAYLYGFSINRTNGYLSALPGSPPRADYANAIAVHPSGKFVFVSRTANQPGDGVYVFARNSNGSLSAVAGSPFSTQPGPASIAVDPTGKYLYVATGQNAIDAFTIDQTSGALTPLPGSPYPVATGSCAAGLGSTIDPFGYFVYTADTRADEISAFTVSRSTGTLTQAAGSPYPDHGGCSGNPNIYGNPSAIVIEATGRYLYAGNLDTTISIYSINAGNGALTFVKNTSSQYGTYCGSAILRTDPSGNFVYTFSPSPYGMCTGPSPGQGSTIGFSINHATGDLTPVPGSPFTIPTKAGIIGNGLDIAVTR